MTLSAAMSDPILATPQVEPRPQRQKRGEVNGWLVLDKPIGMTSTHAVSRLKRIFNAKKAGHAGTLDPLASGLLPVAFGEATKTVPFVQDGEKAYRFRVQWGSQTDTDDTEGRVIATSDTRPTREAIEALLPSFTGVLMQRPPAYSAIKVNGERAYDRARDGETVELPPRPITVHALDLVMFGDGEAVFEAKCGKGTYVRAIARDLGEALGCLGHVTALRRTRVGPLYESHAAQLADLEAEGADLASFLMPVEAGLSDVPHVVINRDSAAQLRRGQSLLLLGRDAPSDGIAYATCGGVVVAFGPVEQGALVPHRVFNLRF
ncbi:tRNA pseudouridine(55) synthase TruB [Lichenihabitans sp. PAMC28606]|nr:tRNA pseudouridine(55) synthase TruB [Lichenihabitans sp. PAMC28606]UDL94787.1 tRNA pseudouridine(55) synthase TruB [Lichenihabitans sp. PAMC28606]